jgi:hypothetical protein
MISPTIVVMSETSIAQIGRLSSDHRISAVTICWQDGGLAAAQQMIRADARVPLRQSPK